ncbi:hypothetical protein D3C85_1156960 [compost metagenome]
MCANDEKLTLLQTETSKDIRRIDAFTVIIEHFKHRATGLDYHVRRKAFAQQVITSDRTVSQIDIRSMIDNTTIDFFGNTHVETAITSFHMEGRDLAALGRNDCHAAICVSQDQQSLWLNLGQDAVHTNNHVTDSFGASGTRSVQKMIRLANP